MEKLPVAEEPGQNPKSNCSEVPPMAPAGGFDVVSVAVADIATAGTTSTACSAASIIISRLTLGRARPLWSMAAGKPLNSSVLMRLIKDVIIHK